MADANVPALELPGEVVYSNHWTGFKSHEIGRLFECIPFEEVLKLEKGAIIWIDAEHPNGKVCGYNRAEVISVQDHDNCVSVVFKGPLTDGGARVDKRKAGTGCTAVLIT
jgi:hypothetical protein